MSTRTLSRLALRFRRPPAMWWLAAIVALAAARPALAEVFLPHDNDGAMNATGGILTGQDLISGSGGGGPEDYNGVTFFALPDQPVDAAALALTVAQFSGLLNGANVDVWGLGFVTGTLAMSKDWFLTADTDTRPLLNGEPPVKLADNIVTAGQTVAVGTVWQSDAAQSAALKEFLNALYDKGAKPGDYAVIRVNTDASQFGVSVGVRWGGSHRTSPDQRATLFVTMPDVPNRLVNAGFESGTGTAPSTWVRAVNGFLAERSTETPRTGESSFRFAVNGDQSGNQGANNANLSQNVDTGPIAGKTVTLSGFVRHNSAEPLVAGSQQKVEFRLWWYQGNTMMSFVTGTALLPTDPVDTFREYAFSGVAPAGTDKVQAMVIFRTGTQTRSGGNPAITTGAAVVDDLRLTVFEPLPPEPPRVGTCIVVR